MLKGCTDICEKDVFDGVTSYRLVYGVVESRLVCEQINQMTYGLIARITNCSTGDVDSVTIEDISTDRNFVTMLSKKMAEHEVTPISLPYIIDDLL